MIGNLRAVKKNTKAQFWFAVQSFSLFLCNLMPVLQEGIQFHYFKIKK